MSTWIRFLSSKHELWAPPVFPGRGLFLLLLLGWLQLSVTMHSVVGLWVVCSSPELSREGLIPWTASSLCSSASAWHSPTYPAGLSLCYLSEGPGHLTATPELRLCQQTASKGKWEISVSHPQCRLLQLPLARLSGPRPARRSSISAAFSLSGTANQIFHLESLANCHLKNTGIKSVHNFPEFLQLWNYKPRKDLL